LNKNKINNNPNYIVKIIHVERITKGVLA